MAQTGSSPRVRGTHGRGIDALPRRRFIPACAGNAPIATTLLLVIAVHPRVCGERYEAFAETSTCAGSSPRVRGTPTRLFPVHIDLRFIPACAGNARKYNLGINGGPVHPRVCGERGIAVHRVPVSQRFIPACAGNAPRAWTTRLLAAVHPRVCGERSPHNRLTYKVFHNVKERTDCSSYVPSGQDYSTR